MLSHKNKSSREYYRRNKDKVLAHKKEYKAQHKDQYRSQILKYKYGISLQDFNDMSTAQEGKCLICKKIPSKLVVDHNHKTGKVRGLLCKICNWYMGKVDNDFSLLERLSTYATS